jgi:hypothetical protein
MERTKVHNTDFLVKITDQKALTVVFGVLHPLCAAWDAAKCGGRVVPFRHHADRKEDEEKIMPKLTTYSGHLGDWTSLLSAIVENEGSLPHLTLPRDQLQAFLEEARDLLASQASQAAAKQQTSRRLEEVVNLGSKLATSLRVSIKVVYGNRSEKLTEFHLRPFRGRPRAATTPSGPEAPAPEASAL